MPHKTARLLTRRALRHRSRAQHGTRTPDVRESIFVYLSLSYVLHGAHFEDHDLVNIPGMSRADAELLMTRLGAAEDQARTGESTGILGTIRLVAGMDDTPEFLAAFRSAMAAQGWARPRSPTQLIDGWKSFVELCEEGYEDTIDEFFNDLSIRRSLENILRDPVLQSFGQLAWVRAEVDAIDGRYRALLLDHDVRPNKSWWKARIPRYAGADLAEM